MGLIDQCLLGPEQNKVHSDGNVIHATCSMGSKLSGIDVCVSAVGWACVWSLQLCRVVYLQSSWTTGIALTHQIGTAQGEPWHRFLDDAITGCCL